MAELKKNAALTAAKPDASASPVRLHDGPRPRLDADIVAALSESCRDDQQLRDLRASALTAWQQADLPYKGLHLWRYSRPRDLFPSESASPASPDAEARRPAVPEGGAAALLTAGADARVDLSSEATAAGLRLLLPREAGALGARLGTLVGPDHGVFEALNGAAWSTGLVVHVPAHADVSGPVHVRIAATPGAVVPRLLVVAERGARATVLEEHVGGGEESAIVSVGEIFVGQNAQVEHVLVQDWADGTRGHVTLRGEVARDGRLTTTMASLGGSQTKVDVGTALTAPGAHSEIHGVVLGDGTQHHDHHTVHDHVAPYGWSNIDLRVTLADAARSAYTGVIRIAEDAGTTEAYQENRNLILSEKARADTIPELEILTDDVVCTHGATVSPVDREQRFYLESRGIAPADAMALLLNGFFEETLARLPGELAENVRASVEQRLRRVAAASVRAEQAAEDTDGSGRVRAA